MTAADEPWRRQRSCCDSGVLSGVVSLLLRDTKLQRICTKPPPLRADILECRGCRLFTMLPCLFGVRVLTCGHVCSLRASQNQGQQTSCPPMQLLLRADDSVCACGAILCAQCLCVQCSAVVVVAVAFVPGLADTGCSVLAHHLPVGHHVLLPHPVSQPNFASCLAMWLRV